SFRGAFGVGASVWPEVLASASSKVRQMTKLIPEMPKDIRSNKARLFLVWLIIGYCWWKSEWSSPLEGCFLVRCHGACQHFFDFFLFWPGVFAENRIKK